MKILNPVVALIEISNNKILVDCGFESMEENFTNLSTIYLTVAKPSHSEKLFELIKNGFSGTIFCTSSLLNDLVKVFSDLDDSTERKEILRKLYLQTKVFENGERFECLGIKSYYSYDETDAGWSSLILEIENKTYVFTPNEGLTCDHHFNGPVASLNNLRSMSDSSFQSSDYSM